VRLTTAVLGALATVIAIGAHRVRPSTQPLPRAATAGRLPDEGAFPGLAGATAWVNSTPLSAEQLRGKVVVIDFWAMECGNCLAALPHVKALESEFRSRNAVVIGVHTPELASERIESNVRDAVRRLGIVYPVAIDGDYRIWKAFNNQYWPAVYIVDAHGRIRYHHFGEGAYDEQEQAVDQLLREATGAAPDYR
jgi:thiol-disulfide isomerase/thioredoxin